MSPTFMLHTNLGTCRFIIVIGPGTYKRQENHEKRTERQTDNSSITYNYIYLSIYLYKD